MSWLTTRCWGTAGVCTNIKSHFVTEPRQSELLDLRGKAETGLRKLAAEPRQSEPLKGENYRTHSRRNMCWTIQEGWTFLVPQPTGKEEGNKRPGVHYNRVCSLQKPEAPQGCGSGGSLPLFESCCRTCLLSGSWLFRARFSTQHYEGEYSKYAMQPKSHENSNADVLQCMK